MFNPNPKVHRTIKSHTHTHTFAQVSMSHLAQEVLFLLMIILLAVAPSTCFEHRGATLGTLISNRVKTCIVAPILAVDKYSPPLPRNPAEGVENVWKSIRRLPYARPFVVANTCEALRAVVPRDTSFDRVVSCKLWRQIYPRIGMYTHYHQLIPTETFDTDGTMYLCMYSIKKRRPYSMMHIFSREKGNEMSKAFHDPSTKVNVITVRRSSTINNYYMVTGDRDNGVFGFPDWSIIWADDNQMIQDAPCTYELHPTFGPARKNGHICKYEMLQRGHTVYERVK